MVSVSLGLVAVGSLAVGLLESVSTGMVALGLVDMGSLAVAGLLAGGAISPKSLTESLAVTEAELNIKSHQNRHFKKTWPLGLTSSFSFFLKPTPQVYLHPCPDQDYPISSCSELY